MALADQDVGRGPTGFTTSGEFAPPRAHGVRRVLPARREAPDFHGRDGAVATLAPLDHVFDVLDEPLGDVTRLTITETHDPPSDPEFREGGRTGWPVIASRLETLLETGRPMPKFPLPA